MIDCNKCANRCGLKEYYEQRGEHIVKCPSYKLQTNADRIRAMSDEELADALVGCRHNPWCDYSKGACTYVGTERYGKCQMCALDWLKQEATDGRTTD